MDRLTEMEAFIGVVEQGGFTDAADRLGVSKSAISKHVSALESRLGVRLLNRTTRRVSPTEIGVTYYEKARKVLADAAEADEMVTAMQDSPKGVLMISAPLSFGILHGADPISGFLMQHPEVSANVTLDDRRIDLVSEGYDVAIRIGNLEDSSLMSRKLGETERFIVAAPAYLAQHGAPERIEDLSGHDLMHYSVASAGNYWRLVSRTGEERQIRTGGKLTADNGDMLLNATIAGLGISCLPSFFLGKPLADGSLVKILQDHPQPSLGIHVVYPPGRYIQPKTRAFIDYLVAWFKDRKSSDW